MIGGHKITKGKKKILYPEREREKRETEKRKETGCIFENVNIPAWLDSHIEKEEKMSVMQVIQCMSPLLEI